MQNSIISMAILCLDFTWNDQLTSFLVLFLKKSDLLLGFLHAYHCTTVLLLYYVTKRDKTSIKSIPEFSNNFEFWLFGN